MNRGPVVDMAQKTKDVLAALFVIQPQINVAGLRNEAATLTEMKGDLQQMVTAFDSIHGQREVVYPGDVIHPGTGGVAPASPIRVMERIVTASREDAVSSFIELKRYMIRRPAENMLDEQLQNTMLMAEVFALRVGEYLNYKEQLNVMNEVNNG